MPDNHLRKLSVQPHEEGSRLDRFLAESLREHGVSREKIKELIRRGKLSLDGVVCTVPRHILRRGQEICVEIEQAPSSIAAEPGALAVLYRDSELAVINKAAGISVHPAPGLSGGTLANRLLAHFPELAALEGFRPGIVHRLDKDTSGLMLAALSERSRLLLAEQFAKREVFKEYLAIVHGAPKAKEGRIDAAVGRDPKHKTRMAVTPGGKAAVSAWRLLYADEAKRLSLLAVRIFTGRTHQVRVHMSHIGHPLVGDRLYAGAGKTTPGAPRAERQMLHAWRLHFTHPLPERVNADYLPLATDEMGRLAFYTAPPQDFLNCMLAASRRMLRVVATGSPGSGKSALARFAHEQGLPAFSADAAIAALYEPGADGHHLLRVWFGDRFAPDERSPVNKAALGKAMGEDENLKKQIDSLMHPLVWHALQDFWNKCEAEGHKAAIAEIPLYLESGRQNDEPPAGPTKPLLVGVRCPFAVRRQRLLHKRGWSEETVAKVESWQWPEEKKMQACDIVIDNDGDLPALERKTAELTKTLERLAMQREKELAHAFCALWSAP